MGEPIPLFSDIQGWTNPVDVSLRITAAIDYVNNGDDRDMRAHHMWQAEAIVDDIGLDDLTTAELAALVAVLIPAHSRFLAGRLPVDDALPRLRLISGGPAVDASADFAE